MNKITNYLGDILFGAGASSSVFYISWDQIITPDRLNTIEQVFKIILLIVSILSFTLASMVHKKKLKKLEDELRKNCP